MLNEQPSLLQHLNNWQFLILVEQGFYIFLDVLDKTSDHKFSHRKLLIPLRQHILMFTNQRCNVLYQSYVIFVGFERDKSYFF